QELLQGRLLVAQILGCRPAGVDQQRNGKRQLRVMLEDRYLLLHAAVVDREIRFLKRPDQLAAAILHGNQQTYQLDVNLERRLRGGHADEDGDNGGCDQERALITESSHSPSTHTSPSAKYSFFQIGTSRFSRLIPSSVASKAGLRCGAQAATTTLASPISSRPRRWIIPTRPIA